jgi:hypothetical protein
LEFLRCQQLWYGKVRNEGDGEEGGIEDENDPWTMKLAGVDDEQSEESKDDQRTQKDRQRRWFGPATVASQEKSEKTRQ